MLIDFHTHIFPNAIAKKTVEKLSMSILHFQKVQAIHARTDGTLEGLRALMTAEGVDISVTMPIATKVRHTATINKFAAEAESRDIISFAGIHPMDENYEKTLEEIAEAGFKGIKLHPEYQEIDIDSPECIRVLKKAEELGLYTTIHAGADFGMPEPYHCCPRQLKNVLECVSGKYIIAAHMGGFVMWDEVEKYLVGTPILMDTAVVCSFMPLEQFKRIVKNHGADKILFGSDCPWESPRATLDFILSAGLCEEEVELIKHKNAEKILGIAPM